MVTELVGYARVSTREERQVFDRQVDALKAAGCGRVFEDRGSGASTERAGLKECLGYLRRGDVLVVLDLDRLGRLAGELIRLVDELESKGVGFPRAERLVRHHDAHGPCLPANPSSLRRDGAQRHPPAGARAADRA